MEGIRADSRHPGIEAARKTDNRPLEYTALLRLWHRQPGVGVSGGSPWWTTGLLCLLTSSVLVQKIWAQKEQALLQHDNTITQELGRSLAVTSSMPWPGLSTHSYGVEICSSRTLLLEETQRIRLPPKILRNFYKHRSRNNWLQNRFYLEAVRMLNIIPAGHQDAVKKSKDYFISVPLKT